MNANLYECLGCRALLRENQLFKERIAALEKENSLLRSQLVQQSEKLISQEGKLARQTEKLSALEERLNTNSRNSSKPPSSDPPTVKPKERKPTGRHRGAQNGHEPNPPHEYDEKDITRRVECVPTVCGNCGATLEGRDQYPEGKIVADLPEVPPEITEFALHKLTCSCCGATTAGEIPKGESIGGYGPRVAALNALLSCVFRISIRQIHDLLNRVFNIYISEGSIVKLQKVVSAAVAAPVEEAKEFVKSAEYVNSDESGWTIDKKRAWIWTVVAKKVTIFAIRMSRGAQVIKELLGTGFKGVLGSDRFGAYNVMNCRRQICFAHLKRDFTKIAERGGESGRIGGALCDAVDRMFAIRRRIRDGTLSRCEFITELEPIRREIESLLGEGDVCPEKRTARTCRRILKLKEHLWTFARIEGVEPTNNAAERALRTAVIKRKLSFGSDSEQGAIFMERILTVAATCKQQGRDTLDYITNALKSHLRKEKQPSLLPTIN